MTKLGVPYSGLKEKLDIYNTSEAEAVAMAFGINISGGDSIVYMQDDGAINTLNVVTTLSMPYGISVRSYVKERGDLEHHKYATELWKYLTR